MIAMAGEEQVRLVEIFSVQPSLETTFYEVLSAVVPLLQGASLREPCSEVPLVGSVKPGVASNAVPYIEEELARVVPPAAAP
jgi:hypothetical protein